MLSLDDLVTRPGFKITTATCRNDHRRWSVTESDGDYRVVLVRRGRFRRRAGGVTAEIDPTLAYLGVPGEEEQFAHPAGGDVCTEVNLSPALWRLLTGDAPRPAGSTVYPAGSTVYVDARLDLAHRRLLAAARGGDADYALAEELTGLLRRMAAQVVTREPAVRAPRPGRPRRAGADRALVAAARAAIVDGHPAASGLFRLAELLRVSPYRLSRAFPRELGVSLTGYRNRVRVGRALDRLEGGDSGLAALAADLGFADQAHLSRTVRAQLGHTPTALRRLLRGTEATR